MNALASWWIKELRSGKHRQITGAYFDNTDGRCALGILEKVIPSSSFRVGLSDKQLTCVKEMNDGRYDFNYIADWIEEILGGRS